jgi:hypothetical protein
MELRKHPLISYRTVSSWPPVWTWIGGGVDQRPKGEIGILKQVKLVDGQFVARVFLWMEHDESMYLGCLLMSDAIFSKQVARLLQQNCGHSIEYIGGLDLGHFA